MIAATIKAAQDYENFRFQGRTITYHVRSYIKGINFFIPFMMTVGYSLILHSLTMHLEVIVT